MENPSSSPASQFVTCGFALCFVCLCPVLILISLTIYYAVGYNSYLETSCTALDNSTRVIVKQCEYYGCYNRLFYFYRVSFLTNNNEQIYTITEGIAYSPYSKNDTFPCFYRFNVPESGVSFQNYFKTPFIICLVLTCVFGGIPLICCLVSFVILPLAILSEINRLNKLKTENATPTPPAPPQNL
jgi:hypothetical protein